MFERETVKRWLGIKGEREDDLVTSLEARQVAWFNRVTGRYWGPPATLIDFVDGSSGPLRVPGFITGTGVAGDVVVSQRINGTAWEAVDATLYEWVVGGSEIYAIDSGLASSFLTVPGPLWIPGWRRYHVAWKGGYQVESIDGDAEADPPIPADTPSAAPLDVQDAILTMCAVRYRNRPTQMGPNAGEDAPSLADVPRSVRDVIERVKRPVV